MHFVRRKARREAPAARVRLGGKDSGAESDLVLRFSDGKADIVASLIRGGIS